MRLCWADRIGIVWAGIAYFVMFVIAQDKTALLTPGATRDMAIIILPGWLFLRAIDFIAGGPAKRRGQFRVDVR